jgi:hypothetical protein
VPESRYHDVLDHITPIFLRDEPLSQCFPYCTTGQREQEFRSYSETQLRSGLCVMALDGSAVVGACLSRPLTRDQLMGCSIPPSDDPGMSELQFEFASYSFMSRHSTVRFKQEGGRVMISRYERQSCDVVKSSAWTWLSYDRPSITIDKFLRFNNSVHRSAILLLLFYILNHRSKPNL